MANLTSVGVTAGVPTSGTGTVSTLDNLPTLLGTVKAASTAPIATDPALVTSISPNSAGIVSLGQATKSSSIPVTIASDQGSLGAFANQYPSGATPIIATGTGTTAATTATLAGAAGKTTYIVGFSITADATSLTTGTASVTGLTGTGTLNFIQTVSAVASGASALNINFPLAIPASSVNTAIVVTSAAAGTLGNTVVSVWGYQL